MPAGSKESKPIIGVTGGIGAGKSLVAKTMGEMGAVVVDSDRLAHEELSDPPVVATLRQWWGEQVVTKENLINRGAVGKIVFSSRGDLQRLEDLLYPRIDRRRQLIVNAALEDAKVKAIVYDAPKLFEAGLDRKCDFVVFVDAPWSQRVKRIARTRGWDEAEVRKREKMQDPLESKKAKADYVVINQFNIETLRTEVERVFQSVLSSFPG